MNARRAIMSLAAVGSTCIVGLASSSAAAAEGSPTVVVAPAGLDGELPPNTDTEVRTIMADSLSDGSLEVVEHDARCSDDECWRDVANAAGARYLLAAEITGDEDDFAVSVTLRSGETGEVLGLFEDSCSICGFVEVRDMTRMKTLDARAELVRLEVDAARRASDVTPSPEPSAAVDRPGRPQRMMAAGWALGGAGAASTLGGTVLLALHERSAGCIGDAPDGGCVPVRYTTARTGAVLLGAGVAVIAGGVAMVLLGRRARRGSGRRVGAGPGSFVLRF